MNKLKFLCLFLLSVGLLSCSDAVYEQHKGASPGLKWEIKDVKTFKMDIPDTQPYDVIIALRHHTALKEPSLPIKYTLSGEGINESNALDFPILDQSGNLLGSAAGDICDTEMTVLPGFSFPKAGKYTLTLAAMGDQPLPAVMEVGVKVMPLNKGK